jgi:penicillin G amidase
LDRSHALALGLALLIACRQPRPSEPELIPAPPLPQVAGSLAIDGLSARVTVVRDRSGIPHITASNQDDLFFAQGFVQAQDRLFQMDLWRRSVQGRLSEVLGANFIERDAMTRRIQFRGSVDADWASYGPDAQAIATAFTRGINAWIATTRNQWPEEFALAGWSPEEWRPEDLLNRTEAFLASNGALEALFCARLVQAIGSGPKAGLLAFCPAETAAQPGVDLSAINDAVPNMFRRVGTRPFFLGLNAPVPGRLQSESPVAPPALTLTPPTTSGSAFAMSGARTASGAPLLAGSWTGDLDSPGNRYLIHLQAPGWNVIGATAPWRPGVAMGHNERIAWSFVPGRRIAQQVFVERLNPANAHQVATPNGWRSLTVTIEKVAVKGRPEPFESEQLYGPHGPIIALDRDRHLAYAVRWSGLQPGGAPELGSLMIGRAQSWPDFQRALEHWQMPVALFAYGDVEKRIATPWAGRFYPTGRSGGVLFGPTLLPVAGWQRERPEPPGVEVEARRSVPDPRAPFVIAVRQPALEDRLRGLLSEIESATIDDLRRVQHDVVALNAGRLIPALAQLQAGNVAVDAARARLMAWDRHVSTDSRDALLYVTWEERLLRELTAERVPAMLADEFAAHDREQLARTSPTSSGGLMFESMLSALDDVRRLTNDDPQATWGRFHLLTFRHPLAITARAARRYNAGPFSVPGYQSTVFASWRTTERSSGSVLQLLIDVGDWDRSRGILAPGQSAAPDSPHFSDLAPVWARGEDVALPFSDAAVAAATENVLILDPR